MIYQISLLLFLLIVLRFTVFPVLQYFLDPKGLQKHPNLHLLSGVSNLPFIFEAHRGFRFHKLLEAHKKHPVVRIGPNSLPYGSHEAIKDIQSHRTECSKDLSYAKLAGSHSHLVDVIDKGEHARKRKILSSAYAIKNLVSWGFKGADMTNRFLRAMDERCTTAFAEGQAPSWEDLTVDFRKWSNMFTIAAIANIGLSEDLGLLE